MHKRPIHQATAIAAFLLTFVSGVSLGSDSEDSVDLCGHTQHDSQELRAQASTRTYWQDDQAGNSASWVHFKLLGFNDFHGHLQSSTLFGRPVGGAAVLASYLKDAASQSKQGAIIVHAGDHVGASPPISALLQDEPSISFLNMLSNEHCYYNEIDRTTQAQRIIANEDDARFDSECNLVGTVGNHEFDEGVGEMLRLINGGIHTNGPFLDAQFHGAKFPYVVANVVYADTGKPVLPPYVIKKIGGQSVAFIGAVLKETPTIVTPTGVAGVKFLDEAQSINQYVPELKKKGIHAIVVTIHQGTKQTSYSGATVTDPMNVGGDIGPIIDKLDDDIDIVIAGHWHQFTNALMPNQNGKLILVTQAFSYSTAFSDIDVAIDPSNHDIVMKSAAIVTTWADQGPGLQPDQNVASLVNDAAAAVDPLVNQIIGQASADILRSENAAGESTLGNLIADAQRSAMGTDVAFMNPGGIRADMSAGQVTWGDVFTIQPFNNDLVKMELTGQQIVDLLNQQWAGQPYARILKTSGISYTWSDGDGDANTLADNAVVSSSISINGNPIDLNATYSVTVNSFMAAGGDNFTVLVQGLNRVIGPVDLDALIAYIKSLPQPFTSIIENRISRI